MANKKNTDKTEQHQAIDSTDELSQLRSIVFGAAEQSIYENITALSNKVDASLNALDTKFSDHIIRAQQVIDNQLNELDKRLSFIDKSHDDNEEMLKKDLKHLTSEHEIFATATQKDFTELNQSLDSESAALSANFHEQLEQLKAHLDEVSNELSSSKTDRKTLAKLLATMATNLEADQL
ncbi:hypothetical protein [Thalassotalea piscium]|uniref:Archaellum component FlaC n=1 Tax=Thalassotalea piscium TaxID=1230533 RepID=A0A7X0TSZ9_9GAMM|nr:hypothetical protein [Thalassotalea piscium]MBB6542671.1 archaellum component FlaC [Thalassotalea piscium]